MISYVVGDATEPVAKGNKIIVHVCNDIGGWGAGFVLALSRRWSAPEAAYRQWFETSAVDGRLELGAVQMVQVSDDIWVANIIGQRDLVDGPDGPPVRYGAIEEALATVADEAAATGASVHMPRIGSGLAGGDWEIIESIIGRTLGLKQVAVTVYDLP